MDKSKFFGGQDATKVSYEDAYEFLSTYEEQNLIEAETIRKHCSPTKSYDIGANIGFWSKCFLKLNPVRYHTMFEPIDNLFWHCFRTIYGLHNMVAQKEALEPDERFDAYSATFYDTDEFKTEFGEYRETTIELNKYAIADYRENNASMVVWDHHIGGNTLNVLAKKSQDGLTKVNVETLSSYLVAGKIYDILPDFIKIDAEGVEPQIVKSYLEFRQSDIADKTYKPSFMIELRPKIDFQYYDELLRLGYKCYKMSPKGLFKLDYKQVNGVTNGLFITH